MTAFFRFSSYAGKSFFLLLTGALVVLALVPRAAQASSIRVHWDDVATGNDVPGLAGTPDLTLPSTAILASGLELPGARATPVFPARLFDVPGHDTAGLVKWHAVRPAADADPAPRVDLVDFHLDLGMAIVEQWSTTAVSTIDASAVTDNVSQVDAPPAGKLGDSASIATPRSLSSLTLVAPPRRKRNPNTSF